MKTLPQEIQESVIGYLDPSDVMALHSVSKEMSKLTTGAVSTNDYGRWLYERDRKAYHNWVGGRLWKLEKERDGLHDSYHNLKKGDHRNFLVYDKCVRMNRRWRWDHPYVNLRGVMDCLADIDRMPIHVDGFPGSDVYYRREGIADDKSLDISEGPTFTSEDIDQIMAFLQRLHAISLEVLEVAKGIQHKHEVYSTFPRKIKGIADLIERRINWLKEQRIHF